jgi:hypothetical protein
LQQLAATLFQNLLAIKISDSSNVGENNDWRKNIVLCRVAVLRSNLDIEIAGRQNVDKMAELSTSLDPIWQPPWGSYGAPHRLGDTQYKLGRLISDVYICVDMCRHFDGRQFGCRQKSAAPELRSESSAAQTCVEFASPAFCKKHFFSSLFAIRITRQYFEGWTYLLTFKIFMIFSRFYLNINAGDIFSRISVLREFITRIHFIANA